MPQSATAPRNAVRAYIRRGDDILVQHKKYEDGSSRFTLPGGAVDPGETLADGLIRECMEEIGTGVEIVDLMYVADYFKPLATDRAGTRQQVEFIFRCNVAGDYKAGNGPKPDRQQVDVLWMPISKIPESGMTPKRVRELLAAEDSSAPVFLGLVE
ncbi:MAG: NUDIX domain-containing protein [Rhodospirillales bacterium]